MNSDPNVSRPLAGAVAFQHQGTVAEWSQAAQLIAMGVGLSGPDEVISDMVTEGAPLGLALPPRSDFVQRRLSWPELIAVVEDSPFPNLNSRILFDWDYIRSYRDARLDSLDKPSQERAYFRVEGANLWDQVRSRDIGGIAAIRLLMSSLYADSEIVRVAGAAALGPLLDELGPLVESVLVDGMLSDSLTVRTLAAHSLAAANNDHPALIAMTGGDEPGEPEPTRTSITVHGTFARFRSDWWKPGSRFHSYLKNECSDDLYGGTDYFRWDGRYDQACRDEAAIDLGAWCDNHGVARLDTVYAHSHGGNVALTAAQEHDVRMKLLVLMDTPAISRSSDDWDAILGKVRRIVSIRSRFDLVILADRSRLRFDAQVRQLLPPRLWFTHGSLLKPKVWDRHNLPNEIAYERGLATRALQRRSKAARK